MTWSLFIEEGQSYDSMIRIMQMALAMHDTHHISIDFDKDIINRSWLHLFESHEQLKLYSLRRTVDINHDHINFTKNPQKSIHDKHQRIINTQDIICRSPEASHYNTEDNLNLIIHSNAQYIGQEIASSYKDVFGFAPFYTQKELPFKKIPIAIDKSIFKQNISTNKNLLIISDGDINLVQKVYSWSKDLDIGSITIFDPYFSSYIYDKKEMPNSNIYERCPSQNRYEIFSSCNYVIVANNIIHTDNHFLWEAVACGNKSIAAHVPYSLSDKLLWNADIFKDALKLAIKNSNYAIAIPHYQDMVDWQDLNSLITIRPKTTKKIYPEYINYKKIYTFYSIQEILNNNHHCETIIIYPNNDIVWQDIFKTVFDAYQNIYIIAPEYINLYQNFTKNLKSNNVISSYMFSIALGLAFTQTTSDTIYILYIQDNENLHIPKKSISAKKEKPMILINRTKISTEEKKASKRYDIQNNIPYSMIYEAKKDYDLLWMRQSKEHYKHGRIYFYPYEYINGYRYDETDEASWPLLLENNNIDLIFNIHGFLSGPVSARNLWAKKNIPIIGMLHSVHYSNSYSEMMMQFLNGPSYDFDAIISPTKCGLIAYNNMLQAMEEWLYNTTGHLFKNKFQQEVIPHGIEIEHYNGMHQTACRKALKIPHDAIVFLCTGKIKRQEKSDFMPLMSIIAELIKHHRNIHLLFALQKDEIIEEEILNLIKISKDINISDHVHVFSDMSYDNKKIVYASSDVFMSLNDNIDNMLNTYLLEAMAASLPIIASDWGANQEMVQHEKTGFLVPTYWTKEGKQWEDMQRIITSSESSDNRDLYETIALDTVKIYDYMKILANNPSLRKTMGLNGQKFCSIEYNKKNQAKKLLDLIKNCIQQAETRSFEKINHWTPFADMVTDRFLHYAENIIDDHTSIMLSNMMKDDETKNMLIKSIDLVSLDEKKLLTKIIDFLEKNETISIQEISEELENQRFSKEDIRMRIFRYLKYSVLTMKTTHA